MNAFRHIDPGTGMFIEDVILEAPPVKETGELDLAYVAVPVPPGFWWPRWNGSTWEEGRTAEEIAAIKAQEQPAALTPDERLAAIEAQTLEQADAIATMYEAMLGGGLIV